VSSYTSMDRQLDIPQFHQGDRGPGGELEVRYKCSTCQTYKGESEFAGGGPPQRNGRNYECRSCASIRLKKTPEPIEPSTNGSTPRRKHRGGGEGTGHKAGMPRSLSDVVTERQKRMVERREQVKVLWEQGLSYAEIGEQLGASRHTIQDDCSAMGLSRMTQRKRSTKEKASSDTARRVIAEMRSIQMTLEDLELEHVEFDAVEARRFFTEMRHAKAAINKLHKRVELLKGDPK
jgi:transposase